jgi:hypothetical protein
MWSTQPHFVANLVFRVTRYSAQLRDRFTEHMLLAATARDTNGFADIATNLRTRVTDNFSYYARSEKKKHLHVNSNVNFSMSNSKKFR